MLTASNALSFLRGPLAFLFLIDSPLIRILTIFAAMTTDFLDGYLARKWKNTSRVGAILDPIMDKFFVYFVLSVLLFENKIVPWQACSMLSRDIALTVFGAYLLMRFQLLNYKFHAVKWGKISTTLQFLVLLVLSAGYNIPTFFFALFVVFGILVFFELCQKIRLPTN